MLRIGLRGNIILGSYRHDKEVNPGMLLKFTKPTESLNPKPKYADLRIGGVGQKV